ncbi:MAG: ribonuclease P protein component [Clostridia bacterium]|nr:ribonuclease P protein component [Clostridia bacterium]
MKNIAIKENHLYRKAYQKGKRFAGHYVAVYVLRDYAAKRIQAAHPQKCFVNRVGLTVSTKLGGAVVRNRAKRVMRAAYDSVKEELAVGNLVVISARSGILGAKSTKVAAELRRGFSKLGLLPDAQKKPDPSDGQADPLSEDPRNV